MIDTKKSQEVTEILKKNLIDNDSSGVFNFILKDFTIFEDIILSAKDQVGDNNIIFLSLVGEQKRIRDKEDLIFSQVYQYLRRNISSGGFFLNVVPDISLPEIIYFEKNDKRYIYNSPVKNLFLCQEVRDSSEDEWDNCQRLTKELYIEGRIEF